MNNLLKYFPCVMIKFFRIVEHLTKKLRELLKSTVRGNVLRSEEVYSCYTQFYGHRLMVLTRLPPSSLCGL